MAELALSGENIRAICRELGEKSRRLFLGRLASEYGYGGIAAVARIALVSRQMVSRGLREVENGEEFRQGDRSRKIGGGRKKAEETHRIRMQEKSGPVSEEERDLPKLVKSIAEKHTYGDPKEGKIYCSLTVSVIREAVAERTGQSYSDTTIRRIMKELNYTPLTSQIL